MQSKKPVSAVRTFIGRKAQSKRALLTACIVLVSGGTSFAQPPADPMPQTAAVDAAEQNRRLLAQIAELRAQIARLQAPMQAPSGSQSGAMPGMSPASGQGASTAPSMGMMGNKGEMGAMPPKPPMPPKMPMMMPPKPPMPMGGAGGMAMMEGMGGMPGGAQSTPPAAPAAAMGMCCMGEMGAMPSGGAAGMGGAAAPPVGGMAGMSGAPAQPPGGMAGMSGPSSAMPGQPGASHLYHIGSMGFFLNHPQHITLTQDQRMTLNRLKERAMLERASTQRRIDQAEQELYGLTGADQPDPSRIQTTVTEIEKLRADERMKFIQAVGEATNVLTHEQHLALMGTMAAGKK